MQYLKQQQLILRWQTFWQKHHILPFFLLFIFAFGFLFWLQNTQSFADPDSFYHAKIIWMMQEKIANNQIPIFQEFPWLYYTVLKTNYIDHHFFYHLLSIPFILFAQLLFKLPMFSQTAIIDSYQILIGFKLATVTWAALFIVVFYWLLKKLKIKGAIFYSLLLLITNPFVFRLSLGKATAASLVFLFFGIYFCYRDKGAGHPIGCPAPRYRTWPLFLLSFFYVWLYGGWPLMLVVVGVFVVADGIVRRRTDDATPPTPPVRGDDVAPPSAAPYSPLIGGVGGVASSILKSTFTKQNTKLLITTATGLLAGLIINPYFPKNLIFYYHQIYQIAIINYQNILNVGSEWYSYNFFELLSASSPVFLLAIPAIIFFVGNLFYYFKKRNDVAPTGRRVALSDVAEGYPPTRWSDVATLIFSFILAIIFLGLTLKSRRHVEYLFPFLVLFIASSFDLAIKNFYKPTFWHNTFNFIRQKWLLTSIAGGFFIVALPYIVWRDVSVAKQQLTDDFSWNTWRETSEWLKNNVEPQEIIFHNDWDDWPFLFFHNDQNYYIVGLDPTFMYNFDAELYQAWSDATLGQNVMPLNVLLPQKFNSEYILVDDEHSALERQIVADGNFKKVFGDEKTMIFKLQN